ncbi:hypothetical protein M413DRAFT_80310 [Hebeloma cylindrosporum]|uniref:Uncharacterized protein n=1 Tax=Hebeloma cylindrosporum TaxID=76867 RepID=A0A0C3CXF5_HEBCY|nr:hypothetical protein M413DRAFT_80310 [Hebeloma cylindrosporum h7]
MSTLQADASDSEDFLECKEVLELEENAQRQEDDRGTWLNAKHDPFILKFPPEISSHIFFHAMDASSYSDLKKVPTSILLGSVCRGWRLLARSTPELWSTLSFSLAKPSRQPEGLSQLQAVTDWMQLSGGVPLILRVFKYWGGDPVSQEVWKPVIDVLNQHSGRWHQVLLQLPPPFFQHFCGIAAPTMLYDLHVVGSYYDVPPYFKLHSRPSPTRLTISHFPVSTFDIVWDNLTFLHMTLIVFDGCIEAIQQAPFLESCSITLYWMKLLPSIPKITVRLTRLRTLSLSRFPIELHRSFLEILELPSLQAYRHQSAGNDFTVDNVISLLNRSGTDLKQLTLDVHAPRVEEIRKLLIAVPHLENLYLDFCCSYNDATIQELFDNLCSSPSVGGTPEFLPVLQSLTIYGWGISIWECIPLLFGSPHRKYLRLETNKTSKDDIDKDVLRKILLLVEDGASIRISRGDVDYLQQFKESPKVLGDVDHALGVQPTAVGAGGENEGFLYSFSSLFSFIFCRR